MGNDGKGPVLDGAPAGDGAAAARPREIASSALFGDAREVRIRHDAAVYILRHTSNGKLILTK